MKRKETVVHNADSILSYPEITPGADAWLWSDEPMKGTVLVTENGLRRLLRLVSKVQGPLMAMAIPQAKDTFMHDTTEKDLLELVNESSGIFCEGSLVMSRLFVDEKGRVVVHANPEVDKPD